MSCLLTATKHGKRQFRVLTKLNSGFVCKEPRHKMRIRLIAFPKLGELDEFDLRRFRVGEVYDLPVHLASVLLIGGYAEIAPTLMRDQAADSSKPEF
jgi:hypothetical protein